MAGLPFRALVGVLLALVTSAAIAVSTMDGGILATSVSSAAPPVTTPLSVPPALLSSTSTGSLTSAAARTTGKTTRREEPPTVRVPVLSQQVVAMMDDLTAVFEHGKITPQYANVVNDQDGCGVKAGWISFCSQVGDMAALVGQYSAEVPNNPLARYLSALKQLADKHSEDTGPLGGTFEADWKEAARDVRFRQTQLRVGHDTYLTPALVFAAQLGVQANLGIEDLFDTGLMMGIGTGACDGLPKIITETTAQSSGTPASGVSEKSWLTSFNQVRVKHLRNPCTPGRQKLWPRAVDRVQALQSLADQGHWDLSAPLTVGADINITIHDPQD